MLGPHVGLSDLSKVLRISQKKPTCQWSRLDSLCKATSRAKSEEKATTNLKRGGRDYSDRSSERRQTNKCQAGCIEHEWASRQSTGGPDRAERPVNVTAWERLQALWYPCCQVMPRARGCLTSSGESGYSTCCVLPTTSIVTSCSWP